MKYLSKVFTPSKMPTDDPIWESLFRAITQAIAGLWGSFDGQSITGATDVKMERLGRMSWVSMNGSGSQIITLPVTFDGNPVVSISSGTASVSGSIATITASGSWSLAIYGRITEG